MVASLDSQNKGKLDRQCAQNVCKQAVSQAIKSSNWLSCQMDVQADEFDWKEEK